MWENVRGGRNANEAVCDPVLDSFTDYKHGVTDSSG